MAKLKISKEAVIMALPFVVAGMKWLAARTDTTVDDQVAEAVEKASTNPVILAFVISLLVDDVAPPTTNLTAEEEGAIANIRANKDLVQSLFGVAA